MHDRRSWRARSGAFAAVLLLSLAGMPVQADNIVGRLVDAGGVPGQQVPMMAGVPTPLLAGAGTFRWFGLRIYEARLWVDPTRFDIERPTVGPLALELRYARSLSGQRIAETSTAQIKALDGATDDQLARWDEQMKAIFPDVKEDDRLVGLLGADGKTRFVLNGNPIGGIDEPAFGQAFFAVWLDERTSAPDLRAALLANTAGLRQ